MVGFTGKRSPWIRARPALIFLGLFMFAPCSQAADADNEFDSYKLRLDGFWLYANPSGVVQGAGDTTSIDIRSDLSFNRYSTFAGKLDWRFTRKNHLTFSAAPFDHSRQTVLIRTIVFQGQTFDTGLVTRANLHAPAYTPGYQYDIIRRKRGHLAIATQIDIFDTSATISAAAQVSGGVSHPAVSAKGSLVAPLPVAGPNFASILRIHLGSLSKGMCLACISSAMGTSLLLSGTLVLR